MEEVEKKAPEVPMQRDDNMTTPPKLTDGATLSSSVTSLISLPSHSDLLPPVFYPSSAAIHLVAAETPQPLCGGINRPMVQDESGNLPSVRRSERKRKRKRMATAALWWSRPHSPFPLTRGESDCHSGQTQLIHDPTLLLVEQSLIDLLSEQHQAHTKLWSMRVRLESSRPQELQSLHAPSITVEALVMRSKYPGMGSTSTGPASPL
ncbi:hypothetical protein EYF80_000585 [Liparis tanakae]|uniref:Uncharacterized protein n=1 Tax=Liparis tanakae TaxID=230148 RepID=A0A4Z2JH71_9TELE|nr:hypothetical protein EYF80_000585 [Liparis tanakae]